MKMRSGVVGMRLAMRAPRKPPMRLAGAAPATTSQWIGPNRPKTTMLTEAVTTDSADFSA